MALDPSMARTLLVVAGIFGIIQALITLIGGIIAINDTNNKVISSLPSIAYK